MKIKLTCKLYDNDAFYFLKPITDINRIENISVFRDDEGIANSKIKYITSKFNNSPFRFIYRFYQMLFHIDRCSLIVGIYEIPHGLLALIVGLLKRKPVVINVIGNPKLDRRNKGIKGIITNIILRNCDVVTVTGSTSSKYLIHEKNLTPEKVFVLPNTIDTEEYINHNINKKYDIITLGRLSSEKGLDFFIDIISKLKLDFPNIRVGIAGKGPILEDLQSQINRLSLSENITLLGYVEDSIKFLNSGRVFLLTSTTEGLPRTVIQSLSCGTPVVASNVGDLSDLIINNENGYLIEKSDEENFLIAVSSILNNIQKSIKLSHNGQKIVNTHYDHKVASRVWIKIFEYLNI